MQVGRSSTCFWIQARTDLLRVLTCAKYLRSVLALSADLASPDSPSLDAAEVEEEEGSSFFVSEEEEEEPTSSSGFVDDSSVALGTVEEAAAEPKEKLTVDLAVDLADEEEEDGAVEPKEKLTAGFFGSVSSLFDDENPAKEKLTVDLADEEEEDGAAEPKEKLTAGFFGSVSSLFDDENPAKEKLTAGLSVELGVSCGDEEEAPPKEKLTAGFAAAAVEAPKPPKPEKAPEPPVPTLVPRLLAVLMTRCLRAASAACLKLPASSGSSSWSQLRSVNSEPAPLLLAIWENEKLPPDTQACYVFELKKKVTSQNKL